MKHLLGILFCAGISMGKVAAQQGTLPLQKQFLDSTFTVLPSPAGARYRRETAYTADSVAVVRHTYYLSGQLQKREEISCGKDTYLLHSISDSFSEAGQHLEHIENDDGIHTLLLYYPNGQLKRRECYSSRNAFSIRECFEPDGTPIPFFESETTVRYPAGKGDMRAVLKAIMRNFHYPADAQQQHIEGRVFVTLNVTKLGTVENVQVARPFFPSIDAEVVWAIYQLKPFIPARRDGQPVASRLTIPVTLKLQ